MLEGRAGVTTGDVVGGRWRLTDRLGQGAFGQVYRAVDESNVGLGEAAIKVMHPSTSPRERANFHDEIRKIVLMRHPNLVAYLDSGEYLDPDGSAHLYLVTELCQYSLADYLSGRSDHRLTAEQGERLLADTAGGLGHLHSRGLLHRDLKPANVLLGGDDWKLADFGLSRELSATGHYHHGGNLMGTPRFMAPELFESGSASPASDVYALGVTLHQALTGKLVHEANTDVALIVQVTTTAPRIDPALPPHWRSLIERCVERDPDRRPAAVRLPSLLAESRYRGPGPATVSVDHPPAGGVGVGVRVGVGTGAGAGPTTQVDGLIPPGVPGQLGLSGQHGSSSSRAGAGRGPLLAGLVALVVIALVGVGFWAARRNHDTVATDTTVTDQTALPGQPDPAVVGAGRSSDDKVAAAVAAIPAAADAPPGYRVLIDPPGTEEFCAGVPPPRLAYPGLGTKAVQFSFAAQVFVIRGVGHDTEAEAVATMAYAQDLVPKCNAQPLDSVGTGEVWRLDAVNDVTVAGADEVSAAVYEIVGGKTVSTGLLSIYARSGDFTVQSGGSDRATTIYYAELAIARYKGAVAPTKVEPAGQVGSILPGNAGKVRGVLAGMGTNVHPGTVSWVNGHTNDDIDVVVNGSCAALAGAKTPKEAAAGISKAYTDLPAALKGDLSSDDYAQLVGAGEVFYCPDEVQRLGLSPG